MPLKAVISEEDSERARRAVIELASSPMPSVDSRVNQQAGPCPMFAGDWTLAADIAAGESLIAWFAHRLAGPAVNCAAEAQAYAAALAAPTVVWTGLGATLSAELIQALTAQGIPARIIKGQLLAQAVYGDPMLRNSSDIDLVVPRQYLVRTAEHLQRQGFDPRLPMAWFRDERFVRLNREASFTDQGGAFTVDLHWRLANRWNARVVAEGELFEDQGYALELRGQTMPWFRAELLFRIQLAHVISSDFLGLKAWIDLAHTSDLLSPDDWASCSNRCAALGSGRALALALLVLESVFRRVLPIPISRQERDFLTPAAARISAWLWTGRTARAFVNGVKLASVTGGAPMVWRALSQLWNPAMIDFENADATVSTATLTWAMVTRRTLKRLRA